MYPINRGKEWLAIRWAVYGGIVAWTYIWAGPIVPMYRSGMREMFGLSNNKNSY